MTLTVHIFGREVIRISSDGAPVDHYEDRTGVFLGFRDLEVNA